MPKGKWTIIPTLDAKQFVSEFWKNGANSRVMARKFGAKSYKPVSGRASQLGLKLRDLRRMYLEGKTVQQTVQSLTSVVDVTSKRNETGVVTGDLRFRLSNASIGDVAKLFKLFGDKLQNIE
jgi:hypothetical protein